MPGSPNDPSEQQSCRHPARREHPWLLPYNRRIRHLQGITIRNLTLGPAAGHARRGTIDDGAIPSSLVTPTKTLALRDHRRLEHSRSSTDLRLNNEPAVFDCLKQDTEDAAPPEGSLRPALDRMRRRSTMEWSGASPWQRQRRLEDVTGGRMANAFFSLHVGGLDAPVYVSEEAKRVMNPDFRFFDLHPWGPAVTRLGELTVRVWAKNEAMTDHDRLLDMDVNLPSLLFIGKSLDSFRHPFPKNCVLFHLTDGIYTNSMHMGTEDTRLYFTAAPPKTTPTTPAQSSSYDQLMTLSTLDDCIQDALATRDHLTEEITAIIQSNSKALFTMTRVPEAQDRLKAVEAAVTTQRKRLHAVTKKRNDLQSSIERRREFMSRATEQQSQTLRDIAHGKEQLTERKVTLQQTQDEILRHRRRVCEDLLRIYPIEPVPGRSLTFTIRRLALPDSEFEGAREDVTSAALGHVSQVVAHLSVYLSLALTYPVDPRGSNSLIEDPISMTSGPRTYPLFMKGSIRYRFEYGVFLLNKDIEQLSNALGLKLLDIRQTLPNLKYLLYVATAGTGDVPARKAGGFKALLRYPGIPNDSRRASVGSTAHGTVSEETGGRHDASARTLARSATDKPRSAAETSALAVGSGIGIDMASDTVSFPETVYPR